MQANIAICYQMPGYAVIKYVETTPESPLEQILNEIKADFMQDAAIISVEVVTTSQGPYGLENNAIELDRNNPLTLPHKQTLK